MDLFDYKPKMDELFDKDLPDSIRKGQRLTTMTSGQTRFPSRRRSSSSQQHGKCGRLGQRVAAVDGEDRRRHRLHQDASTPRRSTTTRPSPTSAPATSFPAAPASAPGSATAWARDNQQPAGLRRDDGHRGPAARRRRRSTTASGDRVSCRASIRASPCAPAAIRCCFSSNPAGVDAATRRRMLDALAPAESEATRRHRPTPKRRRASPSTRWPSACRSSVPELMNLPASRSTSSTCTARTFTSRARSRRVACWPGGWPSAACASCRSSIAAGTSTATSPAICPTSAATSISPATP